MSPLIVTGDIVYIQTFSDLDQNLEGKVISYDTTTSYATHRVVNDYGDYLITRGDNCDINDPIIMRSQIFGIVDFIMPSWFWIVDFGILIGALVGLCLLLGWMIKYES